MSDDGVGVGGSGTRGRRRASTERTREGPARTTSSRGDGQELRAAERNAAHKTSPAAPQYPIESVDNALRLLLLFEDADDVRLTQAATYLGVATSTAHRLLAMLQYRGFVRQNVATKAYEPGPVLASLAFAVLRRLDVRARARPVLARLHKEFDETVHLGRLEGELVSFLDSIESTRAVRVGSRAGRSLPAHATSSGKAMLSQLTLAELRAVYPDQELEQLTERTLASRAALERELEDVRQRGYAVSNEESEDGVASVAVAMRSASGALYVVNVSVPTHRMVAARRDEIAQRLQLAVAELAPLLV